MLLVVLVGAVPNRYVRESAIESENVDKLSWQSEVFWRRLLNRVDDFGRFTANLELLRASVFPLRLNKVSAADIGKMLLECEQSDLVSTWKGDDGKAYLVMHRWEKGRAAKSRYPEPPEHIRKRMQTNVCESLQPHTDAPDPDPDFDPDGDTRARTLEANPIIPGLDAQALAVMQAYPKYAKDGRQVQGFTIHAQSQVIAAIRRAPDFPWLEAAGLEKQNDYPTDFGKWLAMMPDPVWLEAKRSAKPPQAIQPTGRKKLKELL